MSTIKVNNINPQSGNDLNVTGNIIGTGAAGSLSGSFSGSFYGDGSNITGVTGEWDGSHTGDASITGDLSISGYSSLSSSLNTIESDNTSQGSRITALESFSSSLDNNYASEADLSAHSSSVTQRISDNETNITSLQSFSSSLDATFATDSEVASTYVANANTSSFALTDDVVNLTDNQTVRGNKTFANNLTISASGLTLDSGDFNIDGQGSIIIGSGGDLTMTDGDITSTNISSSLTQNYYRIQFRAENYVASQSRYVRGNISTQLTANAGTLTNIYGQRVDVGVFNDGTDVNEINIGNTSSGSVNINAKSFQINVPNDTISLVGPAISASADLIVSGTIESNKKANKIRFHYDSVSDLPSATTWHGMFAHAHSTGKGYYAHGGNWVTLANASTSNTFTENQIISASKVLTLQPIDPLPSGVSTGSLAISGSTVQLYIYNGSGSSGWNRV